MRHGHLYEVSYSLYTAIIFSHLASGMSRSAVTTGLIGGRVGNKGGVGVSVNLDGTTLLFVNAHLAGKSVIVSFERRLLSSPQLMKGKSITDWQI